MVANRGASSQDSLYRRFRKKPVIAVRETERIFIKEGPLGPPTTTFEGITLHPQDLGQNFSLARATQGTAEDWASPGVGVVSGASYTIKGQAPSTRTGLCSLYLRCMSLSPYKVYEGEEH